MSSEPPDLNSPWPDAGHETIRRAVVAGIAQMAAHAEALSDSFLLGQTAADFAQTVLDAFGQLQATVTAQAATIGDLQALVTALGVRDDADQIRDTTAQADIDALQTALADLQARVAVLEQPLP